MGNKNRLEQFELEYEVAIQKFIKFLQRIVDIIRLERIVFVFVTLLFTIFFYRYGIIITKVYSGDMTLSEMISFMWEEFKNCLPQIREDLSVSKNKETQLQDIEKINENIAKKIAEQKALEQKMLAEEQWRLFGREVACLIWGCCVLYFWMFCV